MTESKLVYRNSEGIRRTSITDSDRPGMVTIHTEADMTEVIEEVKVLRDLQPAKSVNKHLAKVPMTVYEQSIHEQWGADDWKKWLNDPDNAAFRVWQGRV